MPPSFVSNGLTTKAGYIAELTQAKGQFLSRRKDAWQRPQTVLAVDKLAGNVTGPVNLSASTSSRPTSSKDSIWR
jgi:NitT/TauT family transport system substrate-binding protein